MARGYAVWNARTGRVEEVYDSLIDAVEDVPDAGLDPALEEDARSNPLPILDGPASYVDAPQIAQRQSQVPRITQAAFEMSLEEAHARIRRFIPKREYAAGKEEVVDVWQNPRTAAGALLGGNVKLAKKLAATYHKELKRLGLRSRLGPRETTESVGLSMAPYWSGFVRKTLEPHRAKHAGAPNFCAYSTPGCRAGCLVGTGKNFGLQYAGQKPYNSLNYRLKVAKSRMLVEEPDAFGRLLVEAVRQWRQRAMKKGIIPSVRLNIVSDVPWELVFPDLFAFYEDVQWYDYTKVPNREAGELTLHPNYDLTYSYAGTGTIDRTTDELERGLRVAVVFLTKKHKLPDAFLGVPVIDGDLHDLRWIDPPQVVVGLAYKRPLIMKQIGQGRGKATRAGTDPDVKNFVVPVEEIEGELVVVETPRQTEQGDDALHSFDAPTADQVEVTA